MPPPKLPTNADQLVSGPYALKNHFFLLARADKSGARLKVTAENFYPILAAKSDRRDEVLASHGIALALREEHAAGAGPDVKGLPPLYTISAGPALWVIGHDETTPKLFLTQAPETKKWELPGMLANGGFAETVSGALNSRTGILYPSLDGRYLAGLNFRLPESLPQPSAHFAQAAADKRGRQSTNIQAQLARDWPQHAGKPVKWRTVATTQVLDSSRPVDIDFNGAVTKTFAHAVLDEATRTVHIHPVLLCDLNAVDMRAVDLSSPLVLAPAARDAKGGLFTVEDAIHTSGHRTETSRGFGPAAAAHIRAFIP